MAARFSPVIVAALALSAGCLQKDVAETWYLGSSGAITWVVTESDVRSDAQALADRQNEENTYRLAYERQDHPVARGFRELGLAEIRTFVLRGEAPFTVRTEARGVTIDVLGRRIIQRAGLAGTSTLERDGNAWVWNFTARDPHAQDVTTPVDDDLSGLLGDLSKLNVVIVDGRFESAIGFTLSGDKRVATFIDLPDRGPDETGNDEVVTLRLRWVSSATS